jgi:hypothetical protein
MKHLFTVAAVIMLWGVTASAQEKPRLYVEGTGTTDVRTKAFASATGGSGWAVANGRSHSAVSAHDETVELMKTFQQRCPGVALTVNGDAAEYAIRGNHESNQKGLLHKRDQIAVVRYTGEVVFAGNTRSVGSAVQEACAAVMADWKQHPTRRPELVTSSEPATTPAPTVVALAPASAPTALHNVPGGSVQGFTTVVQPASQPAATVGETQSEPSLGDAARKNRQAKQQQEEPAPAPAPAVAATPTQQQIQQLLILNKLPTDKEFSDFVENSMAAWINADQTRIARWKAGGDSATNVLNEAFAHVIKNLNAAHRTQ